MTDPSKLRPGTVAVMFLQQYLQDQENGTKRTLAEYQAMFPSDPAAIASEFEELAGPEGDNAQPPSSERYVGATMIGRGGMGTVFQAVDPRLGRTIAIKHLNSGIASSNGTDASPVTDAKQVARFLNEARITAQLQHPNIVPVHEVGEDGASRPFFTMPLIEGRTLADIGATNAGDNEWPLVRSLGVLAMVCDAVGYAHAKGVIHRDLKPSNIMVGRYGEAYVVDWGLARKDTDAQDTASGARAAESALLTMAGDIVGTPAYMAPEQASGDSPRGTKRGDVYSLGATIYQLLTGSPPYVDTCKANTGSTIDRVKQGPPTAILALAPDCPAPLIAICEKAMARDPKQRYPSATELAADLRAYLENRVVQAYATGPLAELRTWVRRNRGFASMAMLAALLLLAGIAVSTVLKLDADENARVAEQTFELAFESVENVMIKFGTVLTSNYPGADESRGKIARKALAYYQELVSLRGNDPKLADKVALSHFRIATLLSRTGEAMQAAEHLAKARTAYEQLERNNQLQDRHRVAMMQVQLEANLLQLERGEATAAIAALTPLLVEVDTLLRREPDSLALALLQSTALHNMALSLTDSGSHEEALAHADKNLLVTRQFVATNPGHRVALQQLGSGLQLRGRILERLNRPEKALAQYKQARDSLHQSLRQFPNNRELMSRYCETLNNIAVMFSKLGQPDDAFKSVQAAVIGQRHLVDAFPGVRDYLGNLAGSECNLGSMFAKQNNHGEAGSLLAAALKHVRAALAIDATHDAYRNYRRIIGRELANHYITLGHPQEAAETVRELLAEQPNQHSWQAAVQFAACATVSRVTPHIRDKDRKQLIQQFGDEAMQHLHDAKKAGTLQPQLLRDASFEALRTRPDFQMFLPHD